MAKKKKPAPDFHAILGRMSDGMAIVGVATRSLTALEQCSGSLAESDAGEELVTLEHGMRALRSAYDEMDVALRAVLV